MPVATIDEALAWKHDWNIKIVLNFIIIIGLLDIRTPRVRHARPTPDVRGDGSSRRLARSAKSIAPSVCDGRIACL
jgi:hypothetical protein